MLKDILELDEGVFLYLNNLGTPAWDSFWLYYTEKITHLPMMLVIAFLLFKVLGPKKFGVSLVMIAVMIALTDQLTNLAKFSFERPRPCRVAELENVMRYIAKGCGRFGYFSGHSSNSMALAFFLGHFFKQRYKGLFAFLVVWAFGMGYSRIYIGVHYPLDLITGFTVGALIGFLFYKLHGTICKKYNIQ